MSSYQLLQNAAKRRQERLLRLHAVEAESKREYYEEMIRQAKINPSAQSEDDPALGRMTTGSGYAEMVALRELDNAIGAPSPEANGTPPAIVQETKIDGTVEGSAVIVGEGLSENMSEVKLLREESVGSRGENEDASYPLDNGVLNPITEAAEEEEGYPDSAAPYLVSFFTCLAN